MGAIDQYVFLIGASLIVIVSYLFNLLSKRTNIPSVLMLITLGVLLALFFDQLHLEIEGIEPMLKVLGVVGLIMIVLEAALDLELKPEKWGLIWKSFSVALLALLGQALLIGYIFALYFDLQLLLAMTYATPLAIMSSAIVLPSVGGLGENKKEFMIYEATFSDILGIIFFYSLLGNLNETETTEVVLGVAGNIAVTIIISILLSYVLAYVFHRLTTRIKLFLLIAVLIFLYAIGKQFHLSSLIIILVFGVVINNYKLFFRGALKRLVDDGAMTEVQKDLHLITGETSFVVRTFFFVVFGISISLAALLDIHVVVISLTLILGIYLLRGVFLRIFRGKNIFPEIYISPRGLITILLFYALTQQPFYNSELNDAMNGILLFVIISSSIIMTAALVRNGNGAPVVEKEVEQAEQSDAVSVEVPPQESLEETAPDVAEPENGTEEPPP